MALPCKMASPVIAKDLLQLFFFFSLLFMEGTSLECETCVAQSTTCSGKRHVCLPNQDTCISWVTERTAGTGTTITATKSCSTQSLCRSFKRGASGWSGRSRMVVRNVQCSKAPPSPGPFLLAPSGLLLLKLLM